MLFWGEYIIMRKRGKILIVDDEPFNVDYLEQELEDLDYDTISAENGKEALDQVATEAPDLILLDIMMPDMDGFEVLEHLKADKNSRDIPVIIISALDDTNNMVRGIELGAEDYLPKPFNEVLLKARITTSLEKKWLRDQQKEHLHQLDLENKRKSEELEQARHIQRSMLPDAPPILPHLEIAARLETAFEIGGDYYDFFPKTNNDLLIAIGDATGHGVGAGLMVSMTKALLSPSMDVNFSSLLSKINNTFNKINLGDLLNMALLLLEISRLDDGQFTVKASGGGMPPIYILTPSTNQLNEVKEMLVSGLPLGITPDAKYTEIEFTIQPGDTLVLMSDGLPERFNTAQNYIGFEHLTETLKQVQINAATAQEILETITNIGHDWAEGHPLQDDTTVIVIKTKTQYTFQESN